VLLMALRETRRVVVGHRPHRLGVRPRDLRRLVGGERTEVREPRLRGRRAVAAGRPARRAEVADQEADPGSIATAPVIGGAIPARTAVITRRAGA
jgi:hypothetical protein